MMTCKSRVGNRYFTDGDKALKAARAKSKKTSKPVTIYLVCGGERRGKSSEVRERCTKGVCDGDSFRNRTPAQRRKEEREMNAWLRKSRKRRRGKPLKSGKPKRDKYGRFRRI